MAAPLTPEQRALVEGHLHLARWGARRSPAHWWDDAYQDACEGLISAARAWDPDRGVTFGAFAQHRVRGAVLDGLKKRSGWLRRAKRLPPPSVPLDAIEPDGTERQIPDERPALEDEIVSMAAARWLLSIPTDPRTKTVLEILAVGGTQRDAAAALGVTESAVSLRLRQLRARAGGYRDAV